MRSKIEGCSEMPDPDSIELNGEQRHIAPNTTLGGLLDELGVPRDGVAIAIDGEVVPRTLHDQTVLIRGMRVEIIRAVGGG